MATKAQNMGMMGNSPENGCANTHPPPPPPGGGLRQGEVQLYVTGMNTIGFFVYSTEHVFLLFFLNYEPLAVKYSKNFPYKEV